MNKSFGINKKLQNALALCKSGQLSEAKAIYTDIQSQFPNHPEMLTNLGTIELQFGNLQTGIELLKNSLNINPKQVMALENLGNALIEDNNFEEAIRFYDKAISINPSYFSPHYNKGRAFHYLKRFSEAVLTYELTIKINPHFLAAYNSRGVSLNEMGKYEEAVASYDQAIQLNPHFLDAFYNRGVSLNEMGKYEEAVASYDQAIQLNPHFLDAFYNRGVSLNEMGKYEEAVASYDQAIQLNPHFLDAFYNRGVSLNEMGKYEEAVASYDQAIQLNPSDFLSYNKKGISLLRLKKYSEACANYLRATQLKPDFAEAHYNLGQLYLSQFNFSEGWSKNSWRFSVQENKLNRLSTSKPTWDGISKVNKLYVWAEQGIGDQILYISMLNDLEKYVENITVSVNEKLITLMRRSFPKINFINQKEKLSEEEFDAQIAMADLGGILRPNLDSFNVQKSYLIADRKKLESTRNVSERKDKLFCGLSWRSFNPVVGDNKSIPFEHFLSILKLEGIHFINLQYGDISSDLDLLASNPKLNFDVIENIDLFEDVDGMLSIIDKCDLVITVSNSTAHLAGGLGKETLLLVPYSSGKFWYWNDIDGRSLWYPSVRIFKQTSQGDWTEPLSKVIDYMGTKYV